MSKDLSEESNVSFTLSISLVDKMCVRIVFLKGLYCAFCRFDDKEVQKDMKLVPYKIVNKDGKPYIQVKIKDGETKVFSPEEISAMVLTKMKETAEAFLGKKIKDAVVTVPGKVKFLVLDLNSKLI